MKRLTYRDKEGRAQWMPELLEDDTGMAGAIIRGTLADYEDADSVKVQHGHWARNRPDDIVLYCSECMMPQDAPSNYCPSCGARMDKEDEHNADTP